MRKTAIRTSFKAALVSLALLYGACQKSETVAPDGSTLSLAATPASILLNGGVQASPVTILATVRNSIGVPLPGQDVRFTQSSGVLAPQAGTPVATDSLGNAVTVLTGAVQSSTISAQAGKATATLTLQTTTCNISTIGLSLTDMDFINCSDTFTLTATLTDASGDPCIGVLVTFAQASNNGSVPATDVNFVFTPGGPTTDQSGQATTVVSLANDCGNKCVNAVCITPVRGVTASAGGQTTQLIPCHDDIP